MLFCVHPIYNDNAFSWLLLQNKSQRAFNNASQDKPMRLQRFMNSRSSLRQVLYHKCWSSCILPLCPIFLLTFFKLVSRECLHREDQTLREINFRWQMRLQGKQQLLLFPGEHLLVTGHLIQMKPGLITVNDLMDVERNWWCWYCMYCFQYLGNTFWMDLQVKLAILRSLMQFAFN